MYFKGVNKTPIEIIFVIPRESSVDNLPGIGARLPRSAASADNESANYEM